MPPWAGPGARIRLRGSLAARPSPRGRRCWIPPLGRAVAACSATASTWRGLRGCWPPPVAAEFHLQAEGEAEEPAAGAPAPAPVLTAAAPERRGGALGAEQ
eukprot:15469782-Alexandrium_andersonii.AAC.1